MNYIKLFKKIIKILAHIHLILTKLESSKSCLMYGLTIKIRSHSFLLQGTGPFGSTITLVPLVSSALLSNLSFFEAGASSE